MTRNRKLFLSAAVVTVLVAALFLVPRVFAPAGCPMREASPEDVELAVRFGDGIFSPEQWRLETGTHPGLISVGWFDDTREAIVHMQILLYDCGYTQADIDSFYSAAGFDVMLGGYEYHAQRALCTAGNLTLHEFEVGYEGRPYRVRFWIDPISPTRVRDMHLGFFPEDADMMEEYAAKLYPVLPSCA